MNPTEIHEAANGSLINNRPIGEVTDILRTALKRLALPTRCYPGDLPYVAQQMYYRHRYTVEELYLAIDYYNAGELDIEISHSSQFGVQSINALMKAYRIEVNRCLNRGRTEDVETDLEERNIEARKQICRFILDEIKAGREPSMMVMHPYKIAYDYLLTQGLVTAGEYDHYADQAKKMYTNERMTRQGGVKQMQEAIKIGVATIDDYQAYLTVMPYFHNLANQQKAEAP